MVDVFISYSRKDIAFAHILHKALKDNEFETWIDWQDIPPSTDWLAEVYAAIEQANTFIFVISQTSVASEICGLEIAHAAKNNKRLIPIVVNEVEPQKVHPSLAALNWIFFREQDEFSQAFQDLIDAVQTDHDWVKEHTRLQVRALEWDRKDREGGYLLRGGDLDEAERWLAQAADKDPQPTALHTEYILTSRQAATRRQRVTLGAVLVGLVIAVALGVLAWTQRNQAVYEGHVRATAEVRAVAESTRALNAESTAQAERATAQAESTRALNAESTAQAERATAEAESTRAIRAEGTAVAEAQARATAQADAEEQRDEAERQARLARSGLFSVEALSHLEDRLDLALLLGVESISNADTVQSRSSLLNALTHYPRLSRFLHGHAGHVSSVAFSPDGQILASVGCAKTDPTLGVGSCSQGEILLWKTPGGHLVDRLLTEHTTFPSDLVFSPDGFLLVSSGWGGKIIFWDMVNRQPLGEPLIAGGGRVLDLAFSPDGKTVASCHEVMDSQGGPGGEIRIWDAVTQQLVNVMPFLHQVPYSSLAFNPDGRTMVAATNSAAMVRLWEVDTWEPITDVFDGYDDVVYSLAYSSDGQTLALGNYDGSVILWDMVTDQPIGEPLEGHTDIVNSVAFSPDGRTLASTGADKTIRLWDVASHRPVGESLAAHTENVASVAFHPDGALLASGGDDHTVILWDLLGQTQIGQVLHDHSNAVWDVAFSPDGEVLGSASEDNTVALWDMTGEPVSKQKLIGHLGAVYSIAFSPDGALLASGGQDATVRLWDRAEGRQVGLSLQGHEGPVIGVDFSPGSEMLASGGMDSTILLWEVNTGEIIGSPLKGHRSTVTSLAFSPDGHTLASASCAEPLGEYCTAGEIRLWDLSGSQIISRTLIGHTHFIYALAFSPDGKTLASGSADKTILLWEVTSGQPSGEPIEGHQDIVTSLAFSPGGDILASGSVDQSIILMDVASRQTIGPPLTGHGDAVTSLDFSSDGQTLASGSFDSTVILWDLDPDSWTVRACQRAGRNLDHAEWLTYFQDESYHKTCTDFPRGDQ